MAMVDVTIRGAGIVGLSLAWECCMRGARVAVIDPNGPGAGASGGILGALAPHTPENWNAKKAFQFESLCRAGAFWRAVDEAGGGASGYGRLGRLQPVESEQALARARERAVGAKTHWQGYAQWELVRADTLPAPWCIPSPTGWLIRDTLSARLHPRRAIASLVAALTSRGVVIAGEGADQGQVVWASGVRDLRRIGAALGRSYGSGIKGQAALLGHASPPDSPQLFADGLHIVPHQDGTVAIGSTTERVFESAHSTDMQLCALIDKARSLLPALADAPVIERWAALRPRSLTRAPVLGPHPLQPGAFIANGGFKIGFGMAPQMARAMADLMLEGNSTGIPESFFPQNAAW